jgi:capsular exopolysaccharide synthesis family protein
VARRVGVDVRTGSVLAEIIAVDRTGDGAANLANAISDELATAVRMLSPQRDEAIPVKVTVVSPATAPTHPFSPVLPRDLALGLALGLLLAAVQLYVREVAASPVRTRDDVRRLVARPVLGLLVHDKRARQRPLAVDTHPHVARAENIRMLRTNLSLAVGESAQCIAVVSARPGEGRTSLVVNLAIALSHIGRKVLLVDADLRRPKVAPMLGLDSEKGLSDVLTGDVLVTEAIQHWAPQKWDARGIDVLVAGNVPPNPSELLASERMRLLLQIARERYDTILLDTSPLLSVTDGAIVSARSDGTLLLVDTLQIERKHVVEAMTDLKMAGSGVVGVVLNNVAEDKTRHRPWRHEGKARADNGTRAADPTASVTEETASSPDPTVDQQDASPAKEEVASKVDEGRVWRDVQRASGIGRAESPGAEAELPPEALPDRPPIRSGTNRAAIPEPGRPAIPTPPQAVTRPALPSTVRIEIAEIRQKLNDLRQQESQIGERSVTILSSGVGRGPGASERSDDPAVRTEAGAEPKARRAPDTDGAGAG